jgi:hypothetical protein
VYVPSQDDGAEGCLHSEEQLPEPAPDVKPGAHHTHAAAPAAENLRAGHATHAFALDSPVLPEKVPAAQTRMPAPTTLAVPSAPPPGQYWPAGHSACTPTSAAAMYRPAATTQAAAPAADVAPAAQGVHATAPVFAAKKFAAHSVGVARLRVPQKLPAVHCVHAPPVKPAALWKVPGRGVVSERISAQQQSGAQ